MGVVLNKQDSNEVYGLAEFYADTVADVANLPTDCTAGSTCIVKEGPAVYILSTEKVWELLG